MDGILPSNREEVLKKLLLGCWLEMAVRLDLGLYWLDLAVRKPSERRRRRKLLARKDPGRCP